MDLALVDRRVQRLIAQHAALDSISMVWYSIVWYGMGYGVWYGMVFGLNKAMHTWPWSVVKSPLRAWN